MKRIKVTLDEDNVKFFCNEKKGVVVCKIESYIEYTSTEALFNYKKVKSIGKAVCGKDNKYDEVRGRQIAESRAKVELYRFLIEQYVQSNNIIIIS